MGIGIKSDAAGIGLPESDISVRVPEQSSTGMGLASAFFFILVPDWLDVGLSGIPVFSKTV
jgi:hypothetical protein